MKHLKFAGNYFTNQFSLEEAVDGLNIFLAGLMLMQLSARRPQCGNIISLGLDGKLIAIDKDPEAIECAKL